MTSPTAILGLWHCTCSGRELPHSYQAVLAFGVLLLLLSATVVAQDADDPRSSARARFGPLYFTPTLQLKEFGIDTNVFNEMSNPKSDFILTLTPGVNTWMRFASRLLVSGQFDADLVYYHIFDDQRSINTNAGLDLEYQLGRIDLFGEGGIVNTRDEPSHEFDIRPHRIENRVTAGVRVTPLPKLSLQFAATGATIAYDEKTMYGGIRIAETLNMETAGGNISVNYAATPLTTFVLSADASRDTFPLSPLKTTDTVTLLGGVDLRSRALISGSVRAGFRRFRSRANLVPEFSGAVWNASVAYRLLSSTELRLTAGRDVYYSVEPDQPYYLSTAVGVTIRRQLVGPFDAALGWLRDRYAYRNVTGSDEVIRVNLYSGYNVDVGYRLRPDLRMAVGVEYFERRSSLRFRPYNGFRLRVTASYGFEP